MIPWQNDLKDYCYDWGKTDFGGSQTPLVRITEVVNIFYGFTDLVPWPLTIAMPEVSSTNNRKKVSIEESLSHNDSYILNQQLSTSCETYYRQ